MIIIDISHPARLKKLSRQTSNFENAIRRRPTHHERLNDSIAKSLPVHSTTPVRTRELSPVGDSMTKDSTTLIDKSKFEEELQKRRDPAWQAERCAPVIPARSGGSESAIEDGICHGKRRRKVSWKDGRIVIDWKEAGEESGSRKKQEDKEASQKRADEQQRRLRGADERHRSQHQISRESAGSKQTSPERSIASDIDAQSSRAKSLPRGEVLRAKIEAMEEKRKTRAQAARKNRLAGLRRCILKWLPL
ncbi:hypothetical protein BLS_004643 [Venturia inaequalis]|uniref:Uncharacterized protein n=1 Tax=Venturia inaequalis TaxID=5025 RepID=A0A8H3UKP4_VENIN|nr:hypothetical protein BLS_004643 [Venturia inaequalis]